MAVVMGVMAVAARLVRRRQGVGAGPLRGRVPDGPTARRASLTGRSRRARPEAPFEVVFRRPLAKGANLTLVEAAGKQYLLGVTEQSITLLTELPGTTMGGEAGTGPLPGQDIASVTPLPVRAGTTDEWGQAGRTPVPSAAAATPGQPATAWKLAVDSLRERTVRR